MKKFILGLLLLTGLLFSIGQQGGLIRVKDQTTHTLSVNATNIVRTEAGYVALISGSSFVANFNGTDNVFAPITSGITDTEWWFNTDDEIYVTGSGTISVVVYDHWVGY